MNNGLKLFLTTLVSVMLLPVSSFAVSAQESDEKLPSKYDSRDENILGDIKNQGNVGSCWTFGEIGILEAYLKKNNMGDYDFSERHMDMVTSAYYADTINYENGGVRNYGYGGSSLFGISYFYSGKGPVYEKDYSYIPTYEGLYSDAYANTLCKTAGISVKDIGIGAYATDITVVADNKSEVIKEMKENIYEYGAVSASYCHDETGTDETSFYYYGISAPNHEIMVVGWDDSYPKSKFISSSGTTPENDGAWIVRNSWGEDFGEDGYFYISYEDSEIYRSPYIYIERAEKTDYDSIYLSSPLAADSFISSDSNDLSGDNVEYSLNIFNKTANSKEEIKEITASFREGTSYEIYIIDNYSEGGDNFGKRVAAGSTDHDCFKTIAFDPVEITGDDFAVCVKYSNSDSGKSLIPVSDLSYSAAGYFDSDSIDSMSFISSDGVNWKDTIKKDNSVVFMRVYTDFTEDTHNVSFEEKSLSYEYALMTDENGARVYQNPDGTFDVKDGKYKYTVKETGFEDKSGELTVDGKSLRKTVKLKKAPGVDTVNTEVGLKDPSDIFTLYYIYGLEGEDPLKVKSVTVNGKSVKFTQTSDGVEISRKSLEFLSGKSSAEFEVTYTGGTKSSVTLDVYDYTDSGKAEIIANKIKKKVENTKILTSKDIYELSEEASKIAENCSKKAILSISSAYVYDLDDAVGYVFDYTVVYGNGYKVIGITGETPLDKSISERKATMGNIVGWDNIIASDIPKSGKVNITLGGDNIVPKEFLEKASKSNATFVFSVPYVAGEGKYSFTINGKKLTSDHDIDMNLYSDFGNGVYDNTAIYNYSYKILGTKYLCMDSSFDIEATLTLYPLIEDCGGIYSDYVFEYDKDNVLQISDRYDDVITLNSGKTVICGYTGEKLILAFTDDYYVYGDIDMNTEGPDKKDISQLKLYLFSVSKREFEEIRELNPMLYALLDVNEDGEINSDDVSVLSDYVKEKEKAENDK